MECVHAAGTPLDIGRRLGEHGRRGFASLIRPGPDFTRLQAALPPGWLADVAGRIRDTFPAVWAELRGLAEGLDQPLEAVLLWNCRGDLAPTGPEGCSSVAVAGDGVNWLAHNEDGDPRLRRHCFLLDADPAAAPGFVTFCYPGSLPGHTLAANTAGLAYTVNNLRLTEHPPGIPRMVTARALLGCADVDAALAVLRGTQRSGGFHFMMADCRGAAPLSVEAPFHGLFTETAAPAAVHANHLVRPDAAALPQRITASSAARQARLEAWLATQDEGPPSPQALLAILADRRDPVLPVHRTAPDDPDGENTLATALFRLDPGGITATVRASPDGAVVAERRLGPSSSAPPEHS
ncbi:hypothetical protein KBTX_00254 [wastewater metagenome]|uniref:Peptidase C45 hydrolase domain-containing protein n=2 Tax=unclassified sequences TaxID=12908 RepID=A0A5B8R7S0_9ZZZZ|nr:C45 family peptidase [Arhodomonas sp. KWT]QEA03953.1 hypothetical protein KBTEX_00254 [uncultured organism]